MDDAAAADEVDAIGVQETRREDVEVVGDAVRDDCVSRIVSTLCTAA